ncbi:MAG TPA: hypothetical protein VJR90_00060, partial [Gammaproteobacteria bacterium]|nr:hypothetical protein [Gammaproteobacteria bacterium]
MSLFQHLISGELPFDEGYEDDPALSAGAAPPEKPESLDDASVRDVLAAQARTADWLEQLGAHVDDPEGPPQH